jgi:hypothetical protein
LAVSAFLVLTKWIGKSRDSKRIWDIGVIKTSMEIYKTEHNYYPTPDNAREITSTWWAVVWYQGMIWEKIWTTSSLWKTPLDPSTKTGYEYSVSSDYKAYEVIAWLENGKKTSYLQETYAWEEVASIQWTYEWYIQAITWSEANGDLSATMYGIPSMFVYGKNVLEWEVKVASNGEELKTIDLWGKTVDVTKLYDWDTTNDEEVLEKITNNIGEYEQVQRKVVWWVKLDISVVVSTPVDNWDTGWVTEPTNCWNHVLDDDEDCELEATGCISCKVTDWVTSTYPVCTIWFTRIWYCVIWG